MGTDFKLASNLAPFSRLSDRFVCGGYGDGYAFEKQLELISTAGGIAGVALGWPCQFDDGAVLRTQLANHGLQLATVDTDIYTEPRFRLGSLTNVDPAVRRAAVERIKGTIDAALTAGSPDINLWPGHDGFDYSFQGHYGDAWSWLLDGLHEVADYQPAMPISIEYKCKEPRANSYLANMGKAMWLVERINRPHVGITLDVGHSLAALENPAECAAMALQAGRLQQVHLNDNYRDWDHDLYPGAVNIWELVEFFFWVRTLGYTGWFSLDIYPYREDGHKIIQTAVVACRTCWELAGCLIEQHVEPLLRAGEHLEVKRMMWELLGVRSTVNRG
jgi:xylose isomerase